MSDSNGAPRRPGESRHRRRSTAAQTRGSKSSDKKRTTGRKKHGHHHPMKAITEEAGGSLSPRAHHRHKSRNLTTKSGAHNNGHSVPSAVPSLGDITSCESCRFRYCTPKRGSHSRSTSPKEHQRPIPRTNTGIGKTASPNRRGAYASPNRRARKSLSNSDIADPVKDPSHVTPMDHHHRREAFMTYRHPSILSTTIIKQNIDAKRRSDIVPTNKQQTSRHASAHQVRRVCSPQRDSTEEVRVHQHQHRHHHHHHQGEARIPMKHKRRKYAESIKRENPDKILVQPHVCTRHGTHSPARENTFVRVASQHSLKRHRRKSHNEPNPSKKHKIVDGPEPTPNKQVPVEDVDPLKMRRIRRESSGHTRHSPHRVKSGEHKRSKSRVEETHKQYKYTEDTNNKIKEHADALPTRTRTPHKSSKHKSQYQCNLMRFLEEADKNPIHICEEVLAKRKRKRPLIPRSELGSFEIPPFQGKVGKKHVHEKRDSTTVPPKIDRHGNKERPSKFPNTPITKHASSHKRSRRRQYSHRALPRAPEGFVSSYDSHDTFPTWDTSFTSLKETSNLMIISEMDSVSETHAERDNSLNIMREMKGTATETTLPLYVAPNYNAYPLYEIQLDKQRVICTQATNTDIVWTDSNLRVDELPREDVKAMPTATLSVSRVRRSFCKRIVRTKKMPSKRIKRVSKKDTRQSKKMPNNVDFPSEPPIQVSKTTGSSRKLPSKIPRLRRLPELPSTLRRYQMLEMPDVIPCVPERLLTKLLQGLPPYVPNVYSNLESPIFSRIALNQSIINLEEEIIEFASTDDAESKFNIKEQPESEHTCEQPDNGGSLSCMSSILDSCHSRSTHGTLSVIELKAKDEYFDNDSKQSCSAASSSPSKSISLVAQKNSGSDKIRQDSCCEVGYIKKSDSVPSSLRSPSLKRDLVPRALILPSLQIQTPILSSSHLISGRIKIPQDISAGISPSMEAGHSTNSKFIINVTTASQKIEKNTVSLQVLAPMRHVDTNTSTVALKRTPRTTPLKSRLPLPVKSGRTRPRLPAAGLPRNTYTFPIEIDLNRVGQQLAAESNGESRLGSAAGANVNSTSEFDGCRDHSEHSDSGSIDARTVRPVGTRSAQVANHACPNRQDIGMRYANSKYLSRVKYHSLAKTSNKSVAARGLWRRLLRRIKNNIGWGRRKRRERTLRYPGGNKVFHVVYASASACDLSDITDMSDLSNFKNFKASGQLPVNNEDEEENLLTSSDLLDKAYMNPFHQELFCAPALSVTLEDNEVKTLDDGDDEMQTIYTNPLPEAESELQVAIFNEYEILDDIEEGNALSTYSLIFQSDEITSTGQLLKVDSAVLRKWNPIQERKSAPNIEPEITPIKDTVIRRMHSDGELVKPKEKNIESNIKKKNFSPIMPILRDKIKARTVTIPDTMIKAPIHVSVTGMTYYSFKSALRNYTLEWEELRVLTPCVKGHMQKAPRVNISSSIEPRPILKPLISQICEIDQTTLIGEYIFPEIETVPENVINDASEDSLPKTVELVTNLDIFSPFMFEIHPLFGVIESYEAATNRRLSTPIPSLIRSPTPVFISPPRSAILITKESEYILPAESIIVVPLPKEPLPVKSRVLPLFPQRSDKACICGVQCICDVVSRGVQGDGDRCAKKYAKVDVGTTICPAISEDDFVITMELLQNERSIRVAFQHEEYVLILPPIAECVGCCACFEKFDIYSHVFFDHLFEVLCKNGTFLRKIRDVLIHSMCELLGTGPQRSVALEFIRDVLRAILNFDDTCYLDAVWIKHMELKYRAYWKEVDEMDDDDPMNGHLSIEIMNEAELLEQFYIKDEDISADTTVIDDVAPEEPVVTNEPSFHKPETVRKVHLPFSQESIREAETDNIAEIKIENIEETGTADVEETRTESANVTETEDTEETATEDIGQTKTESIRFQFGNVEETETEDVEATETENIEETKTSNLEETESVNIQETQTDNIQETKTENVDATQTEDLEETRTENVEETETEDIEETRTSNAEEIETDNIQETENENVEETETENVEETETENVEETQTENVEDIEKNEKSLVNYNLQVKSILPNTPLYIHPDDSFEEMFLTELNFLEQQTVFGYTPITSTPVLTSTSFENIFTLNYSYSCTRLQLPAKSSSGESSSATKHSRSCDTIANSDSFHISGSPSSQVQSSSGDTPNINNITTSPKHKVCVKRKASASSQSIELERYYNGCEFFVRPPVVHYSYSCKETLVRHPPVIWVLAQKFLNYQRNFLTLSRRRAKKIDRKYKRISEKCNVRDFLKLRKNGAATCSSSKRRGNVERAPKKDSRSTNSEKNNDTKPYSCSEESATNADKSICCGLKKRSNANKKSGKHRKSENTDTKNRSGGDRKRFWRDLININEPSTSCQCSTSFTTINKKNKKKKKGGCNCSKKNRKAKRESKPINSTVQFKVDTENVCCESRNKSKKEPPKSDGAPKTCNRKNSTSIAHKQRPEEKCCEAKKSGKTRKLGEIRRRSDLRKDSNSSKPIEEIMKYRTTEFADTSKSDETLESHDAKAADETSKPTQEKSLDETQPNYEKYFSRGTAVSSATTCNENYIRSTLPADCCCNENCLRMKLTSSLPGPRGRFFGRKRFHSRKSMSRVIPVVTEDLPPHEQQSNEPERMRKSSSQMQKGQLNQLCAELIYKAGSNQAYNSSVTIMSVSANSESPMETKQPSNAQLDGEVPNAILTTISNPIVDDELNAAVLEIVSIKDTPATPPASKITSHSHTRLQIVVQEDVPNNSSHQGSRPSRQSRIASAHQNNTMISMSVLTDQKLMLNNEVDACNYVSDEIQTMLSFKPEVRKPSWFHKAFGAFRRTSSKSHETPITPERNLPGFTQTNLTVMPSMQFPYALFGRKKNQNNPAKVLKRCECKKADIVARASTLQDANQSPNDDKVAAEDATGKPCECKIAPSKAAVSNAPNVEQRSPPLRPGDDNLQILDTIEPVDSIERSETPTITRNPEENIVHLTTEANTSQMPLEAVTTLSTKEDTGLTGNTEDPDKVKHNSAMKILTAEGSLSRIQQCGIKANIRSCSYRPIQERLENPKVSKRPCKNSHVSQNQLKCKSTEDDIRLITVETLNETKQQSILPGYDFSQQYTSTNYVQTNSRSIFRPTDEPETISIQCNKCPEEPFPNRLDRTHEQIYRVSVVSKTKSTQTIGIAPLAVRSSLELLRAKKKRSVLDRSELSDSTASFMDHEIESREDSKPEFLIKLDPTPASSSPRHSGIPVLQRNLKKQNKSNLKPLRVNDEYCSEIANSCPQKDTSPNTIYTRGSPETITSTFANDETMLCCPRDTLAKCTESAITIDRVRKEIEEKQAMSIQEKEVARHEFNLPEEKAVITGECSTAHEKCPNKKDKSKHLAKSGVVEKGVTSCYVLPDSYKKLEVQVSHPNKNASHACRKQPISSKERHIKRRSSAKKDAKSDMRPCNTLPSRSTSCEMTLSSPPVWEEPPNSPTKSFSHRIQEPQGTDKKTPHETSDQEYLWPNCCRESTKLAFKKLGNKKFRKEYPECCWPQEQTNINKISVELPAKQGKSHTVDKLPVSKKRSVQRDTLNACCSESVKQDIREQSSSQVKASYPECCWTPEPDLPIEEPKKKVTPKDSLLIKQAQMVRNSTTHSINATKPVESFTKTSNKSFAESPTEPHYVFNECCTSQTVKEFHQLSLTTFLKKYPECCWPRILPNIKSTLVITEPLEETPAIVPPKPKEPSQQEILPPTETIAQPAVNKCCDEQVLRDYNRLPYKKFKKLYPDCCWLKEKGAPPLKTSKGEVKPQKTKGEAKPQKPKKSKPVEKKPNTYAEYMLPKCCDDDVKQKFSELKREQFDKEYPECCYPESVILPIPPTTSNDGAPMKDDTHTSQLENEIVHAPLPIESQIIKPDNTSLQSVQELKPELTHVQEMKEKPYKYVFKRCCGEEMQKDFFRRGIDAFKKDYPECCWPSLEWINCDENMIEDDSYWDKVIMLSDKEPEILRHLSVACRNYLEKYRMHKSHPAKPQAVSHPDEPSKDQPPHVHLGPNIQATDHIELKYVQTTAINTSVMQIQVIRSLRSIGINTSAPSTAVTPLQSQIISVPLSSHPDDLPIRPASQHTPKTSPTAKNPVTSQPTSRTTNWFGVKNTCSSLRGAKPWCASVTPSACTSQQDAKTKNVSSFGSARSSQRNTTRPKKLSATHGSPTRMPRPKESQQSNAEKVCQPQLQSVPNTIPADHKEEKPNKLSTLLTGFITRGRTEPIKAHHSDYKRISHSKSKSASVSLPSCYNNYEIKNAMAPTVYALPPTRARNFPVQTSATNISQNQLVQTSHYEPPQAMVPIPGHSRSMQTSQDEIPTATTYDCDIGGKNKCLPTAISTSPSSGHNRSSHTCSEPRPSRIENDGTMQNRGSGIDKSEMMSKIVSTATNAVSSPSRLRFYNNARSIKESSRKKITIEDITSSPSTQKRVSPRKTTNIDGRSPMNQEVSNYQASQCDVGVQYDPPVRYASIANGSRSLTYMPDFDYLRKFPQSLQTMPPMDLRNLSGAQLKDDSNAVRAPGTRSLSDEGVIYEPAARRSVLKYPTAMQGSVLSLADEHVMPVPNEELLYKILSREDDLGSPNMAVNAPPPSLVQMPDYSILRDKSLELSERLRIVPSISSMTKEELDLILTPDKELDGQEASKTAKSVSLPNKPKPCVCKSEKKVKTLKQSKCIKSKVNILKKYYPSKVLTDGCQCKMLAETQNQTVQTIRGENVAETLSTYSLLDHIDTYFGTQTSVSVTNVVRHGQRMSEPARNASTNTSKPSRRININLKRRLIAGRNPAKYIKSIIPFTKSCRPRTVLKLRNSNPNSTCSAALKTSVTMGHVFKQHIVARHSLMQMQDSFSSTDQIDWSINNKQHSLVYDLDHGPVNEPSIQKSINAHLLNAHDIASKKAKVDFAKMPKNVKDKACGYKSRNTVKKWFKALLPNSKNSQKIMTSTVACNVQTVPSEWPKSDSCRASTINYSFVDYPSMYANLTASAYSKPHEKSFEELGRLLGEPLSSCSEDFDAEDDEHYRVDKYTQVDWSTLTPDNVDHVTDVVRHIQIDTSTEGFTANVSQMIQTTESHHHCVQRNVSTTPSSLGIRETNSLFRKMFHSFNKKMKKSLFNLKAQRKDAIPIDVENLSKGSTYSNDQDSSLHQSSCLVKETIIGQNQEERQEQVSKDIAWVNQQICNKCCEGAIKILLDRTNQVKEKLQSTIQRPIPPPKTTDSITVRFKSQVYERETGSSSESSSDTSSLDCESTTTSFVSFIYRNKLLQHSNEGTTLIRTERDEVNFRHHIIEQCKRIKREERERRRQAIYTAIHSSPVLQMECAKIILAHRTKQAAATSSSLITDSFESFDTLDLDNMSSYDLPQPNRTRNYKKSMPCATLVLSEESLAVNTVLVPYDVGLLNKTPNLELIHPNSFSDDYHTAVTKEQRTIKMHRQGEQVKFSLRFNDDDDVNSKNTPFTLEHLSDTSYSSSEQEYILNVHDYDRSQRSASVRGNSSTSRKVIMRTSEDWATTVTSTSMPLKPQLLLPHRQTSLPHRTYQDDSCDVESYSDYELRIPHSSKQKKTHNLQHSFDRKN